MSASTSRTASFHSPPPHGAGLPLAGLLLLASPSASAGDAVRLEVVRDGVIGGTPPALIVIPQRGLDDLSVHVDCGGVSADRSGKAALAVAVRLPLDASQGQHTCTGTLSITLSDGSQAEMPLSFQIDVQPPTTLSVAQQDLDLSGGTLVLRGDRPLVSATVLGSGEAGELFSSDAFSPTGDGLRLSWTPTESLVLKLVVTATDDRGFASRLELFPWSYSVPHQDVVFETGQRTIQQGEGAKLEAAWDQVQDIVDRYGKVAPVNLYVAGYTDTVGSTQSNQTLSRARAKAIATWFRQRGFAGSIHYQGLGERGLAVPTPDETDEERNRRADYIVAAQAPPSSDHLPLSQWTAL
ncbi:MAG: OmpA family protein [Oligoflexia bacterium]|nr:OmpA family protein [Oligoflexia bacterium]